MPAAVLGLAHHLPPERLIGEVRRPFAAEPGGASDLALPAAQLALERARAGSADVDLIVFATMTADVTFPGSAVYLQDKLGCGTIGALDVRGQCCGFLIGLMASESFIAAGTYRRVLLAAAEVHSSGLDFSPRGLPVSTLSGDGAGVVLLGPAPGATGVASVVCHTDGRFHERFWCEYPASRQHPARITAADFHGGRHFITVDAEAVRSFGREKLPAVVHEALARGAIGADAVDCFVLSHLFPDVAADCARALGVPPSRWINAGEGQGHLTAATLPVALSQAVESGRVGAGARICLAACGAGFTWGAALLTL
jgi:3-oxoacyl-[acyl-carrier-protein] synthase-3